MDNKPSYQVLKAVLAKMEANRRFQIMAACPSLRKVDKAVPLTIQHLEFFTDYVVKINDKIYKLGLIREYRDGNPTETIQQANNEGGLDGDVDEWGFERHSYKFVKTPGDLAFYEFPEENTEVYDDDSRRAHEEAIEGYKKSYSKAVADEIEEIYDMWIDQHETALLPYNCRDTNTKPAHDCFIQLSLKPTISEDSAEPICKLPYTKKLYEAMKSFMDFIFGGRRHPVQVKRLEIHGGHIIRLPEGVKFCVDELKVTYELGIISSVITPVLDESCMPIKHINTYNLDERDHPFVKNAEEFTFFYMGEEQNLNGNLVKTIANEVFQSLPHLRVNFPRMQSEFDQGEFITFIMNMLENNEKRIGTTYQFGFKNKETITEILASLRGQQREMPIHFDDESLILQMEGSKQMQFSYRKNNDSTDIWFSPSEYLLKIEIVEQT